MALEDYARARLGITGRDKALRNPLSFPVSRSLLSLLPFIGTQIIICSAAPAAAAVDLARLGGRKAKVRDMMS